MISPRVPPVSECGQAAGSRNRSQDSVEKRADDSFADPALFSASAWAAERVSSGQQMNVRLYDLTGIVGLGVPRECLLDTDVDVVETVGRTPLLVLLYN
jgi:hypothetical protein